MEGNPWILLLSNIQEDGRNIGVYEGACFWHTDVAYEDPPNSATLVYCVQAPEAGAPTQFADMFAAYDALPERTKRQIEGLTVVHHYGNREDLREGSPTAAERLTTEQKRRVKPVHQPLVLRHPVTGRTALYGIAGSSFGIVGMPDSEALDLLRELTAHATQEEFITRYDFKVGDFACWDTFSTLHKASPQLPANRGDPHARLLWRMSLNGSSPLLGRHVDAPADEFKGDLH
jgi:taurine dioxygenase